ncbi:MAG: hypothetical protein IPK22_21135 [Verrucomicrobiaceae bacterium]|nr:hypothetical protein [Verrucomicrobiaceae bacterium]
MPFLGPKPLLHPASPQIRQRRPVVPIADTPPLSGAELQRHLNAQRASGRPWMLLLGSAVLGLLLVGILSWNAWKKYRAETAAEAAQSAMDDANWPQAGQFLAEAQSLRPELPPVLRAITRWDWAVGSHPERIIQNLQKIVLTRQATDADYLQLARAEQLLSRPTAAQGWLERMSEEARQTLEVLEVETRLLSDTGHAKTANHQLRSHLEARPDDPQARFKLAVLDYSQGDGILHQRGRAQLLAASTATGDRAITALQLLCTDAALTRGECEQLLSSAEKHERAVESRYRILSRLLQLLPEPEVNALIEKETLRASSLPPPARMAFASALATGLPPPTTLAIAQAALTQKNHPLALEMVHLSLETLARLGRWQKARDLLGGPGLALDRIALSLWEACIAAELDKNDPEAARKPLQTAIDASSRDSDPSSLIRCADTALRLGHPDLAATLYEKVAQNSRLLPHLQLQHLEKALVTLRLHSPLLQVLLPLARRLAAHPAARESQHFEADYLALLAGEPPDVIITRLTALPEVTAPTLRIRRQVLWAMIYLQKKQDAAFAREIRRITLEDIRSLPGGPRAVVAGLLAIKGDHDHATQLASKTPPDALMAEEKMWLAKAVR